MKNLLKDKVAPQGADYTVVVYNSTEGSVSVKEASTSTPNIPNNEIWYEATSKLVETTSNKNGGLHTNAFGVAIQSHEFVDSKGTITFDGDVTQFGSYAFVGCSGLTSVEIPNSVTSIGDNAFNYCSSLTSIDIPNSVTSIGINAFNYCSSLTSVDIPNSVTSIDNYAFFQCSSLTSVTYNGASYTSKSALTTALTSNGVTVGSGVFDNTSLSD